MALFEDEVFEEEEIVESNVYLDNSKKSLLLIKKMLCKCDDVKYASKIDNIINFNILPILAEMELNDELDVYNILKKISNKIKEQQTNQSIADKRVIGIGGKFSAGKSCFINSITGSKLPEGQRPTTSIATYIISSQDSKNLAITNNNNLITIDDEAVAALTHQFYDKYKIGFSKLIKNLIVCSPGFKYSNIALLDTPGYSKSDISKADDATDAELAREQLKVVDHLIWLVDSVQGVITQRDIEFISSLNINSEILVVYTKADCEEISNLERKISKAKQTLECINKNIYDVIAYDSLSNKTIIGGRSLNDFLNRINNSKNKSLNISGELEELNKNLLKQIDEQLTDILHDLKEIDNILKKSIDVEHLTSIISKKSKLHSEYKALLDDKKNLNKYFKQLTECVE